MFVAFPDMSQKFEVWFCRPARNHSATWPQRGRSNIGDHGFRQPRLESGSLAPPDTAPAVLHRRLRSQFGHLDLDLAVAG
ncbi:hypothetical protein ABIB66_007722 [Bradyrhizobium sp. F1.13.3]